MNNLRKRHSRSDARRHIIGYQFVQFRILQAELDIERAGDSIGLPLKCAGTKCQSRTATRAF